MSTFFLQDHCSDNNRYSVVIEDDGIVAYAYLLDGEDIIGDVWLYNQAVTPAIADWSNPGNMPFLNSVEFTRIDKKIKPLSDDDSIQFEWIMSDDKQLLKQVTIFVDDIVAVMQPSSKPGWSNNVTVDGPLAKVLI